MKSIYSSNVIVICGFIISFYLDKRKTNFKSIQRLILEKVETAQVKNIITKRYLCITKKSSGCKCALIPIVRMGSK